MEQMAVQMSQQDMLTMLSAAGLRSRGRTSSLQGGGDPFLQIIQNMVAQMMAGQEDAEGDGQSQEQTADQALLAGFAGMLFGAPGTFQQDLIGADTNQTDALVQQLTTRLQGSNQPKLLSEDAKNLLLQAAQTTWGTQLPQMQSQTPIEGETLQSFAQTIVANTQRQSTAEVLRTIQEQGQTHAVQQPQAGASVQKADQSMSRTAQTGVTTSTMEKSLLMGETKVQTVETAGESRDLNGESLFDGQQKFGTAVAQARQLLAGEKRKSTKEVEEVPVQVAADARAPLSQSSSVKLAEPKPMETPRLLDQLTDGLNEELSAGKKEFTMKLKPEELGEITVKLSEKAGKMVVSITTASAQTAKLLNAEMPALRETMRPMQVEVHEAVSQSAQSNQAQMQFNMSGQQFANQQRAFAWQQEKPYYAATSGGEGAVETDEPQGTQTPQSAGLNLYV